MKHFKLLVLSVIFVLLALVSTNNSAMAQSRIFPFYIENADYKQVKVTLVTGGCYEGSPGNGQVFNIPPGEKALITLARVQGHGCNGQNGYFTLEFNPAVDLRKTQNFAFDNGGSLWLHTTADAYPGHLSAKSGKDESYTYKTFKSTITSGKVMGSWELIFGGNISKNPWKNVSYEKTGRSGSTDIGDELTKAISVSLESGMEFELASAKAALTASQEKIQKSFITTSLRQSNPGVESTFNKMVERAKAGYFTAIWQWVGRAKMSDGSEVLIGTNLFTCTPDFEEPNYLPGNSKGMHNCN